MFETVPNQVFLNEITDLLKGLSVAKHSYFELSSDFHEQMKVHPILCALFHPIHFLLDFRFRAKFRKNDCHFHIISYPLAGLHSACGLKTQS